MTRQTSSPIETYSLQASARSAREIARVFTDPDGGLSPEYQRGSVWTEDQRINLVRSWLMGVPIPAVIINDRIFGPWPNGGPDGTPLGGYSYAVIDGKQRIETAIAWFGGALAVPASWFPDDVIEMTEDANDGPYVRYTGLNRTEQRHQSMRLQLPTVEAQVGTIEEEAALYLLVNGEGSPQTAESMGNAARVAGQEVRGA